MSAGQGIRPPWKRTRTGCLTCRKSKVRCDEERPGCARCVRLRLQCAWQMPDANLKRVLEEQVLVKAGKPLRTLRTTFSGAEDDAFYMHHFITFCTKYLAYSNDAVGNPFEEQLVPLASQSRALYYSMAALAAGHVARRQPSHAVAGTRYYTMALGALSDTLSRPHVIDDDAVLGTCLLLCVYEISHSNESLWIHHLQGARDLILSRGALQTKTFLVRFFSLLDVSGSLVSGQQPLISGNYWLESPNGTGSRGSQNWPYYDDGVMVNSFHALMVFMVQLSDLSNLSMMPEGERNAETIRVRADVIRTELMEWWDSRPSVLRQQSNSWRTTPRDRALSLEEILEGESLSSTRSVVYGCIIYLQHIVNPLGQDAQTQDVDDAISDILQITRNTPEGQGLEMGLFFGLFMAGIALNDDREREAVIRQRMSSQSNITLYHADKALILLEALWEKQRHDKRKCDWRTLQKELQLRVFILV